jgi:TorA specific chaperone
MNDTASTRESEAQNLAFVAEWLAQQFLSPPDKARLEAMRGIRGQVALQWIGEILDEEDVAKTICLELTAGTADEMTVTLQRRYTALFEGVFRQRSVLPYASIWDGTGRLFGPAVERMQRVLCDLDVHLTPDCTEPADHVAVQLVALAEALRQERSESIRTLHTEMLGWTGRFTAALTAADGRSFYGNAARLLSALVDQIAPYRQVALNQGITTAAAERI